MRKLTLGQAAKHAKRSKGTISKALNNGNLTGDKVVQNGRDTWQIEPSELQRWMEANPLREHQEVQNTTPLETPETPSQNSTLKAEVETLRQQLEMVDAERERERAQLSDQIEDLRTRLTKADEERTKLTAILTDQRDKATEPPKRGFWARLTG